MFRFSLAEIQQCHVLMVHASGTMFGRAFVVLAPRLDNQMQARKAETGSRCIASPICQDSDLVRLSFVPMRTLEYLDLKYRGGGNICAEQHR